MRTDLIRVHSGEAPEAPKVFTDAERTSLISAGAVASAATEPTEHIPTHQPHLRAEGAQPGHRALVRHRRGAGGADRRRDGALNFVGGNPRDVQIPDLTRPGLRRRRRLPAEPRLQDRRNQQPDSDVDVGKVIGTDPRGQHRSRPRRPDHHQRLDRPAAARGPRRARDSSPPRRERKLKAAGFEQRPANPRRLDAGGQGQGHRDHPPANSTSAITNPITIVVGSGPGHQAGSAVEGQTVDVATQMLVASGFTAPPIPVEVDGLGNTKGQVMGTLPTAGETVPVDTPVQLQVSRGNQFTMPSLLGQFWVDAEPLLRSMGWTGDLNKLSNAQNSGYPTNSVATQSPATGTPIKFGDSDHAELRAVAARTVSATSRSRLPTRPSSSGWPHTDNQLASIRCPPSVRIDSGWNCTP